MKRRPTLSSHFVSSSCDCLSATCSADGYVFAAGRASSAPAQKGLLSAQSAVAGIFTFCGYKRYFKYRPVSSSFIAHGSLLTIVFTEKKQQGIENESHGLFSRGSRAQWNSSPSSSWAASTVVMPLPTCWTVEAFAAQGRGDRCPGCSKFSAAFRGLQYSIAFYLCVFFFGEQEIFSG